MSGMEARPTKVNWNSPHSGMVEWNGGDANLLVMFYNRSVHIPALSVERPVYRDEIYVKIQQPGETLNVIDRPVQDADKQRFRTQWSNFVHDRTQVPEGSPVDLLFPNHPAVAENLRSFGVYTVEQCATLSANAIDTIGRGGQEYVNRAKKYLEMATKGGEFHAMQRELEDEKQKTRILEQTVATLKSQMDRMSIQITDPVRASLNPPFVPNHDVQMERINANSPQTEIANRKTATRRKTVEDRITDPLASAAEEITS